MHPNDLEQAKVLLRRVRRFASFRVFVSMLSHRLASGRSEEVYLALCALGFSSRSAWTTIECWPENALQLRPFFRRMECNLAEAQAMFFAKRVIVCFGPSGLNADWNQGTVALAHAAPTPTP